ncbi:phytolongin Phyl1.1 isoform X1 [Phoenix dactylifera]|uniref:Phytolongin Phyl1.1 isoform X1 n=1 Tax=Phoenix dactylifera TaxID=42345 RepID=A0A8B9AU19_PHODC|nr:phytolongin Phyl1.1 isoform X1 [Phoenix dactylifera]XP_038989967.1 phytolongin Phyl1.1 isoform X1 [Phoenix dactylifera]
MNSRRPRSVGPAASHCKSMEVEIVEKSSTARDSSIDNTVYCCVAKGSRILYSYNSKDRELEALAALCLENAPPFHRWYFHSVGSRTFGYLMEGGCTYFAIVDPSLGNLEILRFLRHIRDGFKRVSRNGFHDELVPIIRQLITSLERMPRPTNSIDASLEGGESVDGTSMSGKTPLLGNSKRDRRKMKDKVVENDEVCEDHRDEGVKIHMPPEPAGNMSLQKSSSLMRSPAQQIGQRLWWRHVKVVVAADIIVCLVLFGVWLAVCKGFQCISSR